VCLVGESLGIDANWKGEFCLVCRELVAKACEKEKTENSKG